jgi:uroporphyrinogen decarboxylase
VDPSTLLGDQAGIRRAARQAVEKTGGRGHILNLGHGILPVTPVENARTFVEAGQQAMVVSER